MGKSDKKRRASELELPTAEAPAAASPTASQPMDLVDGEKPKKKSKKDKEAKQDKDEKKKSKDVAERRETEQELDMEALSPIAHPLADKKLGKKVLRSVKKASKQRYIKRGVKEVVKSLRKGEKGLVVMAADISPIDVLTHIPLMAEEAQCGYIFVPTKEALGAASSTKRPTSCVMITADGAGSAAAKRKQEEKQKALEKSDPEKAKKVAEEQAEYKEAYGSVLREVMELNEKISF